LRTCLSLRSCRSNLTLRPLFTLGSHDVHEGLP
jgi:hypothetical protein